MYFNNIHILYYTLFAILGGVIGQIVDYCSKIFLKEKRILSKKEIKEYLNIATPNYILIFIMAIVYEALLYKFGFKNYLDLIRFGLLMPMLSIAFIVDYKIQIIPNRLNLTMFELGLLFTFIFANQNINIGKDLLLGMLAGGGIFLAITLIGGLIAGKEAMGLGDVKLMGALGLYFGVSKTLLISVLAFLIGAIVSIILIAIKKNKQGAYIPFGPFIVAASIITIFIPFEILFTILMEIFSLGLY